MKEIKLNFKGTYEQVVNYVKTHCNIVEPTKFTFTKVVETNAKMRRTKKYKGIYRYEEESSITLNDNNHRDNLYKKVFKIGTNSINYEKLGID